MQDLESSASQTQLRTIYTVVCPVS